MIVRGILSGVARAGALAALVGVALTLAACGSSTTVTNRLVPKSVEAADLKKAFDQGLLTPQEYRQQQLKMGLPVTN